MLREIPPAFRRQAQDCGVSVRIHGLALNGYGVYERSFALKTGSVFGWAGLLNEPCSPDHSTVENQEAVSQIAKPSILDEDELEDWARNFTMDPLSIGTHRVVTASTVQAVISLDAPTDAEIDYLSELY